MSRIDMEKVLDILADSVVLAEQLHGTELPTSTAASPGAAQINRDLLALSDGLTLAAALTRNEYQKGRGLGHE